MIITLTDVVALSGLVFGLAGAVLGVLNYLRDRVALSVTLQWDMQATEGTGYDPETKIGVIAVYNVGRRSTHISHAALRIPEGYDPDVSHLLMTDSIHGDKLSEGDPPRIYPVSQEGIEEYAPVWRQVVAQVSDSTGKVWTSKRLPKGKVPSWAGQSDA